MKKSFLALSGLALLAAAALCSCASQTDYRRARRALEGGDLEGAVLSAADSLGHDPRNYKALALLEESFPDAVAALEEKAALALEGGEPERWETVALCWRSIHAMNAAVGSLPPLSRRGSRERVVFAFEYDHGLLARASDEAAERRYALGLGLMASGSRATSREAFDSFGKALEFVPGYKDATALAERARELGSDRVAVLPFSAPAGDSGALACARALYGDCVSALVALASRERFLQVVERSAIESLLAERELSLSALADPAATLDPSTLHGANILVHGQVVSYLPGRPTVSRRVESFTRYIELPVPGALPVNGVVPTYQEELTATATVHRKSSSLTISIAYRAVDVETSAVLDAGNFSQSARDEYEWAVCVGDRGALPPAYAVLAARPEAQVKPPEAMLPALSERVAKQIAQSFSTTRR